MFPNDETCVSDFKNISGMILAPILVTMQLNNQTVIATSYNKLSLNEIVRYSIKLMIIKILFLLSGQ